MTARQADRCGQKQPELPIIDAWAQHPTLRHLRDPMFESLRRWTTGRAADRGAAGGRHDRARWTQGGIARSLISAWVGPKGVLISNDEVAGFVGEAPERLRRRRLGGHRAADGGDARGAALRRGLGFKAIRVLPWLWEVPPTDRRFYPVYAACCEMGVPFCTQIGHTGPLMPSEVGRPIHTSTRSRSTFPELVIVAGHIGYPWTDEAVAVATKHENVYIDTSAYTVRRYPARAAGVHARPRPRARCCSAPTTR